jgi:hypothetical protein
MSKFNPLLAAEGFNIIRDKAGSYYARKDDDKGLLETLISDYDTDGECPSAPLNPETPIVVMKSVGDEYRIYPNTKAAIEAGFATK